MLFPIVALLAHLGTAWRYGYFRDELYFIACSKHLAWGYVDQPPLVAFAAYLSAPFHYDLVALRLLPAIAAALTVYLAARIGALLGGGRFAQGFAALAVLLLPAYLLLGNTLTTTSFEPLSWTLVLYAAIRLVQTGDRRYWLAISLAFAFGMYGKYSMLLLGGALVTGLLCTRARRFLWTPWFAAAIGLAAVLLLPNILWQWTHAWPFLAVVQGDFQNRHPFQTGLELEYKNLAQNTIAFALEQVLYANPIALPLWLAGLCAFAFGRSFREFRFIAVTFVVVFAAAVFLAAKGYYVIGIYAVPTCAGCVLLERAARGTAVRIAATAVFVLASLPALPISLPVLPVDSLIAYTRVLGLTGTNGAAPHLIQPLYAEEFGWRELTAHVAQVYNALPSGVRERTGIFADTYGDAGALSFYGPEFGLPPVVSAQNTYYLWGPGGYDGRTLIVVGASQAPLLRTLYRKMTMVATYGNSYKWVVEGPTPIFLCTDPIAPLPVLWPKLRWYGA